MRDAQASSPAWYQATRHAPRMSALGQKQTFGDV
jgi:hypothetical protein